ncbi:hypothetical protein C0Q70_07592 [Pomacea canaliculata]|uniref:Uncharacterized protein n=1 Tax=Pomacea canaliculata TaxID=400727 RepID=A0A2T7PFH1_POMCA|nr:hypothetical protein C0Q70_07592 [Pomacea canaliculata]
MAVFFIEIWEKAGHSEILWGQNDQLVQYLRRHCRKGQVDAKRDGDMKWKATTFGPLCYMKAPGAEYANGPWMLPENTPTGRRLYTSSLLQLFSSIPRTSHTNLFLVGGRDSAAVRSQLFTTSEKGMGLIERGPKEMPLEPGWMLSSSWVANAQTVGWCYGPGGRRLSTGNTIRDMTYGVDGAW